MPPQPQRNREQLRERQRIALEMRQKGHTQLEIARALDCEQGNVSRMLAKLDAQALKDMGDVVLAQKMRQTAQLEWIVAENCRAWEASKKVRRRVVAKLEVAEDEGRISETPTGKVMETAEQTGDVRYLHAAMAAMDRLRSLWGLDVAAAEQEFAGTVPDLIRDLDKKRREYETRRAAEGRPAGDTGGPREAPATGAGGVPDGPQPI